jgi:DNA-binding transcriptional ArsR family regulator
LPLLQAGGREIEAVRQAAQPSGPLALAALIGRTRAGLLVRLEGPLSTSEVAQRTGLSIGGVSRHLAVRREAGLVGSHRRGHAIVHQPTPLGTSLLDADGEAPLAAAG